MIINEYRSLFLINKWAFVFYFLIFLFFRIYICTYTKYEKKDIKEKQLQQI